MTSTFTDRIDGLSTSVAVKAPVVVSSSADIVLSGLQTINGVVLAAGDRVLVRLQTDSIENGIYDVATSEWQRSKDFDGNRDTVQGTLVWDLLDAVFYQVSTVNPITIGTSDILFSLASSLNIYGLLNPLEFGADPTPGVDNTAIIQQTIDAGPTIITNRFEVTGITANNYLTMVGDGKLVYSGAQNGTCLTVNANFGDLSVDGDLQDCRGIVLLADGINGHSCYAERITASATSSLSIYGVSVQGDNISFDTARTYNTLNTGQSNGSFPQAVAIVSTANGTRIKEVFTDLGASSLIFGGSSGRSFVGRCNSTNMTDNGVYQLSGDVEITDFTYQGDEEAYVWSGGRMTCGRITTVGPGIGAFEMQGGSDAFVGEIIIKDDGAGSNTVAKAVIARSSATNVGRVHIGSIKGTIKGNGVVNISNAATVEYIQIDEIDVTWLYDAGFPDVALNGWFDVSSALKQAIKQVTIRIRDINSIFSSTIFTAQSGTPTGDSVWENFDVYFETSAGLPTTAASSRGPSPKTTLLVLGAIWQVNVGPYSREANYLGGWRNSTTANPAGGYWRKGQQLWHGDITTLTATGWICSVSGSPGTWLTMNCS